MTTIPKPHLWLGHQSGHLRRGNISRTKTPSRTVLHAEVRERLQEAVIGRQDVALQVIGIVGDTRIDDLWNPYQPQFFLPYAQDPSHQRTLIVMRVAGKIPEPTRMPFAGSFPLWTTTIPSSTLSHVCRQHRSAGRATTLPGCPGLWLCRNRASLVSLGDSMPFSHMWFQRGFVELGLRMAVGASRSDILGLVLLASPCFSRALGLGSGRSLRSLPPDASSQFAV